MAHNEIIFNAVRPWLLAPGFTAPGRVDALNAACDAFLAANGLGGGLAAAGGFTETVIVPAAPVAAPGLHLGPKGIALIHSFEQCRLSAYPDPGSAHGDPWTIGWGSTGPDIHQGVVWTQEQCDQRFAADIGRYEAGVRAATGSAPTTQEQFDALVSLFYNIGVKAGSGSTVIRKHNAGDRAGAADAFGMWVKNDGKTLAGLVRRRAAEAALYRGLA